MRHKNPIVNAVYDDRVMPSLEHPNHRPSTLFVYYVTNSVTPVLEEAVRVLEERTDGTNLAISTHLSMIKAELVIREKNDA